MLKVQYKAGNPVLATTQLGPYLNIVNVGPDPVPLSELKVRYYFTRDSAQTMAFFCDYSPIGCANISGTFVLLSNPTANADFYVEVGFSSAAGSLAPGAQTGDIQLRINKRDWSLFEQANDYSFDATRTTFGDWTRVTLFRNDVLIWGMGPISFTLPTSTPTLPQTGTTTVTPVSSPTLAATSGG